VQRAGQGVVLGRTNHLLCGCCCLGGRLLARSACRFGSPRRPGPSRGQRVDPGGVLWSSIAALAWFVVLRQSTAQCWSQTTPLRIGDGHRLFQNSKARSTGTRRIWVWRWLSRSSPAVPSTPKFTAGRGGGRREPEAMTSTCRPDGVHARHAVAWAAWPGRLTKTRCFDCFDRVLPVEPAAQGERGQRRNGIRQGNAPREVGPGGLEEQVEPGPCPCRPHPLGTSRHPLGT
jgi:hypothetical protein